MGKRKRETLGHGIGPAIVTRLRQPLLVVAALVLLAIPGFTVINIGRAGSAASGSPLVQLSIAGIPGGMAIDTAADRAYVADSQYSVLSVLDLGTGTALTHITLPPQPHQVILGTGGSRVYVSSFDAASVAIVDTATQKVAKILAVGGLGLALDRVAGRLYAAGGSSIAVIDTATEQVTATIQAPSGAKLWGLAVDSAAQRLYVTDLANPRLLVYGLPNHELQREIALDAPARLALAVDGAGRVYVGTDASGSQILAVDGASGTVLRRTPTDPFPAALVLDASGVGYAASPAGASINPFDAATGASLTKVSEPTRQGRNGPGLAIATAPGALYVVTSAALPPPVPATTRTGGSQP